MTTLVRTPRRALRAVGRWSAGAGVATAFALFPSGLGAQSIPVTVGGPLSGLVGVPLQVPIQVDMSARSERLGSFFIRLQWNPAVIRIDSGVNADFGDVISREDSMPLGVLRLTGANPAGVAGRVTVGVGFAVPLTADTTTVRVQVLELYAAATYADLTGSAAPTNRQYCPGRGRYGDLEADGTITARDAQIALMAAVGLAVPAGTDIAVGDIDGDGRTDTRDALIILSRVVGLNTGTFRIMRVTPGACGTDRLATLAVDPGDQTIVTGQRVRYLLKVADSSSNAAVGTSITWSSTNAAVATVTSGGGEVVAVAPGQAVITATESGGRQASATVTVVASRKKHVVDALAFNANNQLGSATLPFSNIQDGVAYAQVGDTVLVRSGRYEGGITITRSITVLGAADTGLVRPFISGRAGTPADSNGVVITAGSRVELRGLRFDTLYQAVHIKTADTVILSDAAFRARSVGVATIYVDSVSTLRIRRSRFDGSVTALYAVSAVYVSGWAKVLDVDSTLITDYGDDALTVYGVDSLVVRNSVLRYNRGYGVYAYNLGIADSARVMRAVFSRNVMTQNLYGDVFLDDYRTAKFDHNVLVGGGYNGIQLYGDSASLISLLGDTLAINNGSWLYTNRFDSLSVDSVTVKTGYYAGVNGGRITVVRNSGFQASSYYGLRIDASPLTSARLVLRNVTFRGDRTCDRCADGVYAYNTSIDADGVTGDNLNYAIYKNYQDLTLTNSTFSNVDYAVSSYCGTVRADRVTITDGYYGLQASGCSPDTLLVDHSTITSASYGVSSSNLALVVRNTVLNHGAYGVYAYGGTALVEDNQFRAIGGTYSYAGTYVDGNDVGELIVRRNTLACDNQYGMGIELYDGPITVSDNVVGPGCQYAIYTANGTSAPGTPIEVRNNTVTMSGNGYYGIASVGSKENARIVKNTVTGPTYYGSIYVGYTNNPRSVIDSNTITNSAGRGIRGGSSDTLRIMDNTITNHLGAPCCGYNAAIVLEGASTTNAIAQVLRNRITFSKSSGIMLARYTSGDTVTVLVDSNSVRGADTVGVWVRFYSRALLRKNAIDSSGFDALRVSDNYLSSASPVNSTIARRNSFTRSGHFGVNNSIYYVSYPYTVSADSNWWGNANGPRCTNTGICSPSGGDSVSATNVTFSPFLTSAPTDVPTPAPAFYLAGVVSPSAPSSVQAAPVVSRAGTHRLRPDAPAPRERPVRLPRALPPGVDAVVVVRDRSRAALEEQHAAQRAARDAAEREANAARTQAREEQAERAAAERKAQRAAGKPGTP